MDGLSNGPIPDPHFPLTPKPGVEKLPFEISAQQLEIDHMCEYGAYKKICTIYRIGPSRPHGPLTPKPGARNVLRHNCGKTVV